MPQPYEKRITLAYFTDLEEAQKTSPFTHWPQHLTIFPPVVADPRAVRLAAEAVTGAPSYEFPITLGQSAKLSGESIWLLGSRGRSEQIAKILHKRALKELVDHHVLVDELGYIGERYTPYITQKPGQPELSSGREFILNHIAVVACEPDERGEPAGPQQIENIIPLKPRG